MNYQLEIVAVDCLMLRLFQRIEEDNMRWVLAAGQRLRAVFGAQLIDLVPSYTTLLVHYDVRQLTDQQARILIAQALQQLEPASDHQGREHLLPVWYDTSVGPDLQALAQARGHSVTEVIKLHSEHEYQVFALGFAPGFAFMGLVVEALASPRLATPRQHVPATSLGIAERQTAVYPLRSPGGWNLLGRMPLALFDSSAGSSLLQPGDRVRFCPVERDEFVRLGGDDQPFVERP